MIADTKYLLRVSTSRTFRLKICLGKFSEDFVRKILVAGPHDLRNTVPILQTLNLKLSCTAAKNNRIVFGDIMQSSQVISC